MPELGSYKNVFDDQNEFNKLNDLVLGAIQEFSSYRKGNLTYGEIMFVLECILDSLRGLASLYVCIAHCRGNLWIGGEKYLQLHPFNTWDISNWLIMLSMSLTKLSGEAVIFFFVLSGFSIAHSLQYQPSVKMFLLKRFISS